MFCDMVGSSALSARLDPEEQSNVIAAFHACCANEIKSLGGMVAQYLGDGVLAYFGYPTANENDAERAILAGLAILKAVATLKPAGDLAMQTRIAIGSGVVVVGDLIHQSVTQENAAIGETTNLVARLQSIAEPNSIVISPVTHRLVGALFDYRDLGRHTLKGFAEPVHVRQVLGVSKVESRFEAQHPAGASPLLGREEELDLLLRRWDDAKRGDGRVVLLTGEPGIGKSRIARALRDRLNSDPHTPLSYFCSPHHQDSALYPNIGQLTRAARIERDDNAEGKLDKLQSLLAQSSGNMPEDMPLFAALLSIPGGDRFPLPEMTPQRRKERTLAALLDQLKRQSTRQPVLMVFEDLHWIDPTSLELLSLAIELISDQRILLVVTARPEFTPPWPGHSHVSTLSLNRLGRSEGEALIADITKGKSLPPEVREQIIGRTDGVPLFIEELTKTVLESGLLHETDDHFELTGHLTPLAIPSTLHASLLARLDRLASVKDVAQIGAVIGREFSYPLIVAAAALSDMQLSTALTQLVDAGLIFKRGVPPNATYQFKHALVQDAAYASLVRSRRQQLHARIAQALKEHLPETAETEPELLAKHYDHAGMNCEAATCWLQAGRLALTRSSAQEARLQLDQGIKSVRQMPAGIEQARLEFDLHATLGQTLMSTEGYASAGAEQAYVHAEQVSRTIDDKLRLHSAMFGLRIVHQVRGNLETARSYGLNCISLANQINDASLLVQSQISLGHTLCYMGEFSAARSHVADAASGLDGLASEERSFSAGGLHPRFWRPALASWIEWFLGYPEKAAAAALEAIDLARQLGRAQMIEHALTTAAHTYLMKREPKVAMDYLAEASDISRERGFRMRLAMAKCMLGDANVMLGHAAQGAVQISEGTAEFCATGARTGQTMYLAVLANALGKARQFDEALGAVARGQDLAQQSGEHWWSAELHRIKGDLVRSGEVGNADAAERAYRRSLEIAKTQRARSWELRTAISLAILWRDNGRQEDARELLMPLIEWFTEGFDEPDFITAKSLLAELDGAVTPS